MTGVGERAAFHIAIGFNFFSKHCQLSVELMECAAKKACAVTSFVGQQSGARGGMETSIYIKRANSNLSTYHTCSLRPSVPCLGNPLALCTPWNLAPETFSYSILFDWLLHIAVTNQLHIIGALLQQQTALTLSR